MTRFGFMFNNSMQMIDQILSKCFRSLILVFFFLFNYTISNAQEYVDLTTFNKMTSSINDISAFFGQNINNFNKIAGSNLVWKHEGRITSDRRDKRWWEFTMRGFVSGASSIKLWKSFNDNEIIIHYTVESDANHSRNLTYLDCSKLKDFKSSKFRVKARFNLTQGYIQFTPENRFSIAVSDMLDCFSNHWKGYREYSNAVNRKVTNLINRAVSNHNRTLYLPSRIRNNLQGLSREQIKAVEKAVVMALHEPNRYV